MLRFTKLLRDDLYLAHRRTATRIHLHAACQARPRRLLCRSGQPVSVGFAEAHPTDGQPSPLVILCWQYELSYKISFVRPSVHQ